MQNKRMILVMGVLVLMVGAAAFIAGRMLNQKSGPRGFGMPIRNGDVTISIQITPAPELPTTRPEVHGLFVERNDNSIILSSVSMDAGGQGVVVANGGGEFMAGSPKDNDGPKVEVIISNETTIYLETTQPPSAPTAGETQVWQQTVAEGSLDDLTSQSFVTVWGRKTGDRVIAEILFISNPVMFKIP
jgi:hypothetical protein